MKTKKKCVNPILPLIVTGPKWRKIQQDKENEKKIKIENTIQNKRIKIENQLKKRNQKKKGKKQFLKEKKNMKRNKPDYVNDKINCKNMEKTN